jgi:indolepyruvate ferredoxin oxidoreductase
VVVTDEPEKYRSVNLGAEVPVHHRDDLLAVERELRDIRGCTILIYDQTCASEKRRRRKKIVNGQPSYPDPAKRAFINEAVCEGCGDCSVKSNCLSVEPLETEFGRKRQINQSSCNKDYSCVNGFCPSFVTIEGGTLKKPKPSTSSGQWAQTLPEPALPDLHTLPPYRILITGVGGTGVVTIGQLLGMASHLEGKGVSVLDMAGLAQKGGSVFSHVQIATTPQHLHATRIAMGEANLIIGGDAIVSASADALQKTLPGKTQAVISSAQTPTADFVRNPDWTFPAQSCEKEIDEFLGGAEFANFVDAQQLALSLLGDAIYANPLLLGWAWQKGWVPLHRKSLLRAIELNGVSVEKNQQAFEWGRRAAHDLAAVEKIVRPAQVIEFKRPQTFQQMIQTRVEFLTKYQNAAYAETYAHFVQQVQQAESAKTGTQQLTQAVARYLFKLMAYKDEYEVARLHSDPAFLQKIQQTFEGDYQLVFHLAPPLLARKNDQGELVKRPFGAWMLTAFKGLSRLKFLRGTAFDPFGYSAERKMERQLIVDYKRTIEQLLTSLNADNLALCTQVARIPEEIRGYGHVKEKHRYAAKQKESELLAQWQARKAA